MSEYSEHHHPFVHVDQKLFSESAGETLHSAVHLAGRAVTYFTGATMQFMHGSADTFKS